MMNANAANYVPGGPPASAAGGYNPHHNVQHPRHGGPPRGHMVSPHEQPFIPNHYNNAPPHHLHHRQPQHHPHVPHHPQPLMREAILVMDGVPKRRHETAMDIANWWRCPAIIDTITPPKEDDDANPAATLDIALQQNGPDIGRFVIAGFLWNHPHEIHHIAAVLQEHRIALSAVVFVDTEATDLLPDAFQPHDKPAHPLYCEVATMYFNEKNNFYLSAKDLKERFKPGGGNLLHHVFDYLPAPHKPWGSELRMAEYSQIQDLREKIRALLGGDLVHKFPTHFLNYPLFARHHETISKKCMVSYDFEGDRGFLVRYNNKDYLMFGTSTLVYIALDRLRAPGVDKNNGGISLIFEVHSAKKKGGIEGSHYFVTDVVYHEGTLYSNAPYDERQRVVTNTFKGAIGCKWTPVPTVDVANFNWKAEVDFEVSGYQFFEVGGSNRVFLFKIVETSTANIRLWGGGKQDEVTYNWTFQGCVIPRGEDDEVELPNADIICSAEIVDQEKVHFGTVVRARMEKPSKPVSAKNKLVWRAVDRNWTTNYPTSISRNSSPWTAEGLFNALATLKK